MMRTLQCIKNVNPMTPHFPPPPPLLSREQGLGCSTAKRELLVLKGGGKAPVTFLPATPEQ